MLKKKKNLNNPWVKEVTRKFRKYSELQQHGWT